MIKPSLTRQFLAPYRRITSTGRFIPEIDGLRFLAIFCVYLYHLAGDVLRHSPAGYVNTIASNGLFRITQVLNIGVPIFFVISGFILGLPFAEAHVNRRQTASLKKYYLRRVSRLEPPYLLCLLLFFVLKIAAARGTAVSLLPNLIASIFYLHNPIFGEPSRIEIIAWSLEVEIQFYVLAPLLAFVFAIRSASVRRTVLTTAVLLTSGLSILVQHRPAFNLSLLGYAQFFIAGFLLVEFHLHKMDWRSGRIWDLLWVAGSLSLLTLLLFDNGWAQWLTPWLILLLFVCTFLGVGARSVFTNPWIATVGGMCYSIYLLHNYLIAAIGFLTESLSSGNPYAVRILIQLLLMSPVVLATSALYFRLIERPCMNPEWPSQLRRKLLTTMSRGAGA